MGDKPSVEAKSFQSDIDDHNLYHFVPVNPQDVHTSADVADSSLTDCALSSSDDTGDSVTLTQPDVLVNGMQHSCYVSPSLSSRLASSPQQRMKQSKSANHNINGDAAAASCRDGKRSLSMDAKLTSADGCPADYSSVDNNCEASSHNEAVALVEPPSPSTSSTVTVVSVVQADNEGRREKPGQTVSLLLNSSAVTIIVVTIFIAIL